VNEGGALDAHRSVTLNDASTVSGVSAVRVLWRWLPVQLPKEIERAVQRRQDHEKLAQASQRPEAPVMLTLQGHAFPQVGAVVRPTTISTVCSPGLLYPTPVCLMVSWLAGAYHNVNCPHNARREDEGKARPACRTVESSARNRRKLIECFGTCCIHSDGARVAFPKAAFHL
jgi:hypothetical protein